MNKKILLTISLVSLVILTGCLGLFNDDNNDRNIDINESGNNVSGEIDNEDENEESDETPRESIDSQYYNQQPSLEQILTKHTNEISDVNDYQYEYTINSESRSENIQVRINKTNNLAMLTRGSQTTYYDFDRGELYRVQGDKVVKGEISSQEISKIRNTGDLIKTFLSGSQTDNFIMSLDGQVGNSEEFIYETDNSRIVLTIEDNIIRQITLVSENTRIDQSIIEIEKQPLELPSTIQRAIQQGGT